MLCLLPVWVNEVSACVASWVGEGAAERGRVAEVEGERKGGREVRRERG